MDAGYIKIYRAVVFNWVFKKPEYFRAWIYILFRANWKESKMLIGAKNITIKRGEFVTSINNFARETGLSEQRVRTFWKLLEDDSMILRKSTSNLTKITVCKYDDYQVEQQTNNNHLTNEQQQYNNSKEIKDIYKESGHLSITWDEFNKLADEYGNEKADQMIDRVLNYSKNSKYKSLYLTANNWLKKDFSQQSRKLAF